MEIALDKDAKAVLEFMQVNVPTNRLVSVAQMLPQMARLLWAEYPQEPFAGLRLIQPPLTNDLLQDANVSGLEVLCADGDSAKEEYCR